MQDNKEKITRPVTRPRLARTRFVSIDDAPQATHTLPVTGGLTPDPAQDIAAQPTTTLFKRQVLAVEKFVRPHLPNAFLLWNWNAPIEDQSTAHLMQLSGMMRPLRTTSTKLKLSPAGEEEDGYWPLGIQQAGPIPIVNLYGREPFGRTMPRAISMLTLAEKRTGLARWRAVFSSPIFKICLGLAIGLGLFGLVYLFVDLPLILHILEVHLTTTQGIGLALLAGGVYLTAHVLRGVRWKIFLSSVSRVTLFQTVRFYLVGTFLNFLLPIRAGEAIKCLMLKRIANVPISKSLSTVAMDKTLDLVLALVVLVTVPLWWMTMSVQLWVIVGLAGGLLFGLLVFAGLAIWRHSFAIGLLQKLFGLLPRNIGSRIEGFATGSVDAFLAVTSRPLIFLPTLLITCLAVLCDGLFAMLIFWMIGFSIPFTTALFGYILCTIFSVLPTPPGQLGSREAVALLIFGGLLGLPANEVIAATLFAHPWTALLLSLIGLSCLATLGLTIFGNISRRSERVVVSSSSI